MIKKRHHIIFCLFFLIILTHSCNGVGPEDETPSLSAINLISPTDNALNQSLSPTFNWQTSAGASNYHIQISINNNLSSPIIDTDAITTTSYRYPNSLQPQTTYYWRVRAENNVDVGPWSETRSFTTEASSLSAINLISPTDNALNQSLSPTFNWQTSAGASNYHIQISINNNLSSPIIDIDAITTTSYRHPNSLQPQTTYYWRVRAENNSNVGPWSEIRSFTTEASSLSAINLISPADNALNQPFSPTFNWQPSAGASNYHIQISINNNLFSPIIDTDAITTTSYRYLNSLQPQTTYYWRVRAENNSGVGPWSEIRSFTTEASSLSAINLISPADNALNQSLMPTFNWQASAGASNYHIQISINNNLSSPIVNTDTITITSYQYSSDILFLQTIYYWRVRAENNLNVGPWSEIRSFATEGIPPPSYSKGSCS